MGGVEFRTGELFVEREPNDLDDLAVRFTTILDDMGLESARQSGLDAEPRRRVERAGCDS